MLSRKVDECKPLNGGGAAASDVGVKGNAVLPRAAHRAW
jgi:hypothetical protein